jgi:hypothetical protein
MRIGPSSRRLPIVVRAPAIVVPAIPARTGCPMRAVDEHGETPSHPRAHGLPVTRCLLTMQCSQPSPRARVARLGGVGSHRVLPAIPARTGCPPRPDHGSHLPPAIPARTGCPMTPRWLVSLLPSHPRAHGLPFLFCRHTNADLQPSPRARVALRVIREDIGDEPAIPARTGCPWPPRRRPTTGSSHPRAHGLPSSKPLINLLAPWPDVSATSSVSGKPCVWGGDPRGSPLLPHRGPLLAPPLRSHPPEAFRWSLAGVAGL